MGVLRGMVGGVRGREGGGEERGDYGCWCLGGWLPESSRGVGGGGLLEKYAQLASEPEDDDQDSLCSSRGRLGSLAA